MALILDTGPTFAGLDSTDAAYESCRRLIANTTEPLAIPAPVLVEVDDWVSHRVYPALWTAFLDDILAGIYRIEELQPIDYVRIRALCEQYSDSDIGFVDAAVRAVVERLNEPKLATLDRLHFGMMRPRHVAALHLVPE